MNKLTGLAQSFGDVRSFLDVAIKNHIVFRTFTQLSEDKFDQWPEYYIIIGYTQLPNQDILLHLLDAEGIETLDLADNLETDGVRFKTFSDFINSPDLTVYNYDQIED